MLDNLCKVLDGNLDSSLSISNSKAWFGLHHPEVYLCCFMEVQFVISFISFVVVVKRSYSFF